SVGSVRSHTGSTTRNRDHASHAQNSSVTRGVPSGPGTSGPLPQSHCSHSPGSVSFSELKTIINICCSRAVSRSGRGRGGDVAVSRHPEVDGGGAAGD